MAGYSTKPTPTGCCRSGRRRRQRHDGWCTRSWSTVGLLRYDICLCLQPILFIHPLLSWRGGRKGGGGEGVRSIHSSPLLLSSRLHGRRCDLRVHFLLSSFPPVRTCSNPVTDVLAQPPLFGTPCSRPHPRHQLLFCTGYARTPRGTTTMVRRGALWCTPGSGCRRLQTMPPPPSLSFST